MSKSLPLYPKPGWKDNLKLGGMGIVIAALIALPLAAIYIIGHFVVRYW